jgi:hypothetical protein
MPTDKKISQLPVSSGISPSDISVLVDLDTTEQYSFSQLLTYLAANLESGAVFTFGTATIPSNSVGNNGDVYVKTDTGQFAQKLSGTWTVVYTIVQGVVGSTIFYGTVAPTTQGVNGDTYLLTTNGTFYNKIAGTWVAKFSMATGPVGPAGAAGTNGTNGTNGLTVLNGITNPSNGLGVNGDFYINTDTIQIFGPKASGAWPAGVSLVGPPGSSLEPVPTIITAGVTGTPLTVLFNASDYPSGVKYQLIKTSDNKYDWNTNVAKIIPVSGSASFVVYGDDSGDGTWAESYVFSILS